MRWSYRDRQRLAALLRWDLERRPRPSVSLPYVRLEPELKPAMLRAEGMLVFRRFQYGYVRSIEREPMGMSQ